MRSLRCTLFALTVLATVSVPPAPAQSVLDSALSGSLNQVERRDSVPDRTIAATRHRHEAPAPANRPVFPFEVTTAAAALATASKRKRSRGAELPMILDSTVHVMRGKGVDKELVQYPPGKLVDDTDLTDEEIDDLTARRVIRPAKEAELAAIDRGDPAAEREALVREQELEIEQLQAKHDAARAKVQERQTAAREKAEGSSKSGTPEKLAALDDKHATELANLEEKQAVELEKLRDKHVDALNDFDEQ